MTEIILRDASSAHGLRHVILRPSQAPICPAALANRRKQPPTSSKVAADTAIVAAENASVWDRLPDTGRHLHPRSYPHLRSRRGAFRRARLFAPGRFRDAQLPLRSRLFRAGSDRNRQGCQNFKVELAAQRPGDRRRLRPHPFGAAAADSRLADSASKCHWPGRTVRGELQPTPA
jgi:hypothetical protein